MGKEALRKALAHLVPPDDHAVRVDQGHQRIARQLQTFDEPRPGLLHHYTSARAGASIARSQRMRATNLFFMNDSTELAYGMGLLQELLSDRLRATGDPLEKALYGAWLKVVPHAGSRSHAFAVSVFASCYSTEMDDAGQWDAYADKGQGVVLAFRTKALEDAASRLLGKVVYDAMAQRKLLEQALDHEAAALHEDAATAAATEGTTPASWALARAQLLGTIPILELVSRFKHESFKQEREWRLREFHRAGPSPSDRALSPFYLAEYQPPPVSFRKAGRRRIPYIEHGGLGHPTLPIHWAVVGPGTDHFEAADALHRALARGGNPGVPIAASSH